MREYKPDTTYCQVTETLGSACGFERGAARRNTVHATFAGVGDLVRAAEKSLPRTDLHDMKVTLLEDPAWIGRTFKNFDEVKAATDSTWKEGVDDVERMAQALERNLPAPLEVKRRRVWDGYAGDEVCVDRYRHGEDFFRTNARRPQVGPRLISLLVELGQNSDRSSESMKWRGAATVALARILENAGYRAEIRAFVMIDSGILPTSGSNEYENMTVTCELKEAGDSLDISALVNATSGWFFRTAVFASFGVYGKPLESSLGRMQEANAVSLQYFARNPAAWLVSRVYNEASAMRLATALLEQLQGGN